MTMKKVFSILMVAFAMTVMVACNKDDNGGNSGNGGNGGGNVTPTEAAANTLVINGKTYQLISQYEMGGERTYADAETVDTNENGTPLFTIIADVEDITLNQTYTFPNIPEGGAIFWSIHDATWEFQIGPVLESGTMSISRTDDLFTYKVNGMMDGQMVAFHISVPESEWEWPGR